MFSDAHDITPWDITFATPKPTGRFDVLLVCIPYSDKFVEIVREEQKLYGVKATIIFSTVAIGTTRQIESAVHSFVEGRHPDLAKSILSMPRWIGGEGGESDLARRFFEAVNFYVRCLPRPEWTEWLKLRSTSKYGVNIEWTRYEDKVCSELGMPYEWVRLFDRDYNDLYKSLGLDCFQRYLLEPPRGKISGHCVRPNAEILNKQYPSFFLKAIIEGKGDAACLK